VKWSDSKDEWTEKIERAHPVNSGSHDTYAIAAEMVAHRVSKRALIDLVNYLLMHVPGELPRCSSTCKCGRKRDGS